MSLGYEELTVAKDLIKELRKSRESKEKLQAEEVAARDRVDISLKTYEELMSEIANLKRENEELKARGNAGTDVVTMLLSKLDIPFENLRIDPNSIEHFNDVDMGRGCVRHMIRFNVEV